jgi:hypothetical protein
MGQTIEITQVFPIGDVAIFHTDRTLTGQEGETYAGPIAAEAVGSLPAKLALELFASDPSIDHCHVASNSITVRRRAGWTDDDLAAVQEVIAGFPRFYGDAEATPIEQPEVSEKLPPEPS